ncbi:autotransporter outer membrane beta-barrel domain-containing protein [Pseudomonas gingeri]|uniref:Autotransporter domain-containing protein n=1 Tax=Pseudomonas gingeri TaxID=117681 RepID=A0A7Y7WJN5_9PSED|nr:autotransporter domain-containing protein [Pseudomonas gingeri]NWB49659.1 autotransporter domain-containing protein [Pseudomonas gingeri]
MHSSRHPSSRTPGRLTVLAIAIASALGAGQASATPGNIGLNNSTPIPSLNNPLGTTINGGVTGIVNSSTIGTLSNSGTVSGGNGGIYNSGTGTITSLSNETGGTVTGGNTGISNGGTIGTLSNSGTIHGGGSSGVYNYGTIGTLNNSGIISSDSNGVGTFATLTSLNNEAGGTISGGLAGIYNGATLTSLNNETGGTISGGNTGIYNAGSIGTLNNSGIVTGNQYALYNISTGTLGTVTNSGTIAGTIRNDAVQDLAINGGTGPVFGVLTGVSAGIGAGDIGQITNTNSNLVFGLGNQLLNDHVNVGTHTVTNDSTGTLQVNNTIDITGNYNQGANASLILGVADNAVTTGNVATDSGYGRLVVSGSANIASGSTIGLQKLGSYGFAQGQRYVVIQANASGTNYNAGTLHYSVAGYNAAGTSVADGANSDLLVTLGTSTSGSTPLNQATSANGSASLAGLFNYGGLNAGLMNLFNAAAALDSSAAGNHAGAQLSPTANASAATQASTASTVQVLNVAAAHLDGLRTAQNDSTGSGVATGESARNTGLWGQAFGGSSHLDERDDIAGYHARYSGFLLGADAALNDSWRAGGLFSYTKTTVNNDGDNAGSSADVKSYGLFGYASYQANPWYLDLSLGAIQHQYDTQREINFSGFNGAAKGQHDGMQYIASAVAGYPIDLGPGLAHTILTPIAGLTYSTLRQDSYTESGGNGAALHLDSSNSTSLKSDLGAKLERSFATSYGSVVPSAQLTWRHEYHDNGLQSVANFAADTSGATSFSSPGAKAIADTGVLALGVTLLHSENFSVGAKYTLEAANGYTANTGDVQARWNF